ncbi:MAG: hypothetical protein ACM3TR_03725 [Caulobacteraceae bacterium]
MNIILRKLIYNESEVYLINWKDKPCFMVSEVSKALDGSNKEDIQLFLRNSDEAVKGVDYDVIEGDDAAALRKQLDDSGVKKRFAKTMILYLCGLKKYSEFRRTMQVKDFINYLQNNKVCIDQNSGSTPVEPPNDLQNTDTSSIGYSELLKHIEFMEDFVNTINKLNISSDKSIAFMKDMTKFLEDNGLKADKLLAQIKKWV